MAAAFPIIDVVFLLPQVGQILDNNLLADMLLKCIGLCAHGDGVALHNTTDLASDFVDVSL